MPIVRAWNLQGFNGTYGTSNRFYVLDVTRQLLHPFSPLGRFLLEKSSSREQHIMENILGKSNHDIITYLIVQGQNVKV